MQATEADIGQYVQYYKDGWRVALLDEIIEEKRNAGFEIVKIRGKEKRRAVKIIVKVAKLMAVGSTNGRRFKVDLSNVNHIEGK